MKAQQFLHDTFSLLYALYFQPTVLAQRLHTEPATLPTVALVRRLDGTISRRQPLGVRRYLWQLVLLCSLAATPLFVLAPMAPQPPSWLPLLLTWVMIIFAGLSASAWQAALGPVTVLALALLTGLATEPAHWVTLLGSVEVASHLQEIPAGLAIGVCVGVLVGTGARRCAPYLRRWPWFTTQLAFVDGLAFLIACVAAINGAGLAAFLIKGGAAAMVASIIAGSIAGGANGGRAVGSDNGVAIGAALGMGVVVLVGATGGSLTDVAGQTLLNFTGDFAVSFAIMTVCLTFVGAVGVATIVAKIVSDSMVSIVTITAVITVVIAVASGVALSLTYLTRASMPLLAVIAALLGFGFSSTQRWQWRSLELPLLVLGGIAVLFVPYQLDRFVIWLIVGLAAFGRLPLYLIYAGQTGWIYLRSRWDELAPMRYLTRPPWHWDELIALPLPFLEQLLLMAGRQDRAVGLGYIEEAAATWRQNRPARRATVRLAAEELMNKENERALADVATAFSWLPEILPTTVAATLGRFRAVSRIIDDKLVTTDNQAQLVKLSAATAAMDELIKGLSFVPTRERALFLPIAREWRNTLRKATGRLPNPYIAGNPLRTAATDLFVGRKDVLRQIEQHLRNRRQRPTLLLFGQRRVGKSSLLYQMVNKLSANIIPVRVDCQAGEMQESNAAFLFNLARAIVSQAAEQRALHLPALPTGQTVSFTTFSLWLESVEQILGERTLLLGLDEFESLGHAVDNGWLDERVLGFLRNLSQHHTQVDLLLAGSHRPDEIDETWSSYLIGATVIEIAYLDPSETRRLIECPIPGFGLRYQPAAVDHIIQLTRCQPLLVQLLCQELVHLLNERGEREAGIAEIEAVVPRALQRGSSLYFAYLRKYDAGPLGDAMLRTLAQQGPGATLTVDALTSQQPDRLAALTRLLARDLVEKIDGGVRFQIELVRRWWAMEG